jgi:type II secretory pathway pseudopilin PulG
MYSVIDGISFIDGTTSHSTKPVISAQAGIQLIKNSCKAGQNKGVDRCAKYYVLLDSRLRGNDGVNRYSRLNSHPPPKKTPRLQSGFTYIGLLILIAIMGVTLAGIGTVWRTTQQRFKENQLLFVGNQFSKAITAYYFNTPGGVPQFPKTLEDLLKDKRYPNTVRYLRKIYADPITGSTKWGLIKGPDGNIVGVYSLSAMAPIKTANFARGNEGFVNKKRYYEWQFGFRSLGLSPLAANAVPGNSTAGNIDPAITISGGTIAGITNPGSTIPGTTLPGNTVGGTQSPGNPGSGNPGATNQVPANVTVADPGAGTQAQPPAEPPPQPPKVNPQVPQRIANYCQLTFNTDASNCSRLAIKFGENSGVTCMASANERYLACMSADPATYMPVLDVQYE